MRVLMLSWEYTPHLVGGLGKHVVELVPELVDEEVEVHLVTPRIKGGTTRSHWLGSDGTAGEQRQPGLPGGPAPPTRSATSTPTPCRRTWCWNRPCQQLIDHFGHFDLIHAHDWLVSFAAISVKNSRRIPLLSTIHATEMGRNHGSLWRADAARHPYGRVESGLRAWRAIACSHYMAWEVRNLFRRARREDRRDPQRGGPAPVRSRWTAST